MYLSWWLWVCHSAGNCQVLILTHFHFGVVCVSINRNWCWWCWKLIINHISFSCQYNFFFANIRKYPSYKLRVTLKSCLKNYKSISKWLHICRCNFVKRERKSCTIHVRIALLQNHIICEKLHNSLWFKMLTATTQMYIQRQPDIT